jgi:hypothetical protein
MRRLPAVQPLMAVNDHLSLQATAGPDPKRSISFLHSRRSAKRNFFAMEISEAAVGDLTQPAMTCQSGC